MKYWKCLSGKLLSLSLPVSVDQQSAEGTHRQLSMAEESFKMVIQISTFLELPHRNGKQTLKVPSSDLCFSINSGLWVVYILVIIYHRFSGLKQHRFVTLFFCRSQVQNKLYWPKIKVSAELHSFWRQRKVCFLSFLVHRGHIHSLAFGTFLHLQCQQSITGLWLSPDHQPLCLCSLWYTGHIFLSNSPCTDL